MVETESKDQQDHGDHQGQKVEEKNNTAAEWNILFS